MLGGFGERDAYRSEALAGLAIRQSRRCVHGVMQNAHHKHCHAVEAVEYLVMRYVRARIGGESPCCTAPNSGKFQSKLIEAVAMDINDVAACSLVNNNLRQPCGPAQSHRR